VPRQLSFDSQFRLTETTGERFWRMQRHERRLYQQGIQTIAGVDEAGRGCLAGPVVAAAVILPPDWAIVEVNDSKRLTPAQRERLYGLIQEQAVSIGVGSMPATVIDECNILQATYRAMEQAIAALAVSPEFVLLDAVTLRQIPIPQQGIIRGDQASISIAAASIVAKVQRDHLMITYDAEYSAYGFARHKGYGTRQHRQALERIGPCPLHRKTFRGVIDH
jgi:ribonuclease HII